MVGSRGVWTAGSGSIGGINVILFQEMGRAMLPSPHSSVILTGLLILGCGSEEQKAEFLPRIAKGELILALALLEESATYNAQGIALSAVAQGDNYLLNGTKLLVLNAHVADWLICATRTKTDGEAEEGVTLFLVDAKSPGITCNPMPTLAGDRQNEATFKEVAVPKKNMLGELNKGWGPLAEVLRQAVVLQCAEILGMAEKVLEMSVAYAKERVAYERPIGSYQAVQYMCTDMARNIQTLKAMTYAAACSISQGLPQARRLVAVAKAYASDTAQLAGYQGHQVFSGIAYMQIHDMQLYSRRLKAAELNLGDADFHRDLLAQEMAL